MAYCSYCAAVLEPGASICARCGRPLASAGPAQPAQPAVPAMPSGRPASVSTAAILLLITCLLGTLPLLTMMMNGVIARLPVFFVIRSFFFWIFWLALAILAWQRQSWVRIAVLLLTLWSLAMLLIGLLPGRVTSGMYYALSFAFLTGVLRLTAVWLLFKPESSAWYKR